MKSLLLLALSFVLLVPQTEAASMSASITEYGTNNNLGLAKRKKSKYKKRHKANNNRHKHRLFGR